MSQVKVPEPVSNLARYRLLSPKAGIRVSPIALGTLNFGTAWSAFMGASCLTKQRSFEILDRWFEAGGNFFDTANSYQGGQSEECLGEWMESRGNRDQVVVSTKFTMTLHMTDKNKSIKANFQGNAKKSLRESLECSLMRLKTSYIDILYVHYWDYTTSVEELMQSLDSFVKAGKVLYLGISDAPAWVVVKANAYAKQHGLAEFVIYQGNWSLLLRDFEREIIPMCRDQQMCIAPYGVLGQGKFKTKAEVEQREKDGEAMRSFWNSTAQSPDQVKISEELESIASGIGAPSLGSVALAYHLQRCPYVIPQIGVRTDKQMDDAIASLSVQLTEDDVERLETVVPFKKGFPYDHFG
ncbi:Aldo/keto reductase [Violaceomyces palustris]|uniref:Aldo/keto reductase n=1 Tax=Violaceomyces palustris TaxID=1673888 RepID=A0ACD0NMH8_9BASI|nr:Aldo/keto reductase [Violaceomyces palustris]